MHLSGFRGVSSLGLRQHAALPQPPESEEGETIRGVPVVNIHDDPAELEFFLKAMFDSDFFMPPPAQTTLATVLGVLRLTHKYDMQFLCCRVTAFRPPHRHTCAYVRRSLPRCAYPGLCWSM
ncbi:hypothetical protein B0H14DRAFT_2341588 [Mycena olivaceomarginata]|nr:hypothetical protein B0H14DRAFT_2341588 [Mycena olivaceomarginata]